ncbi:2-amino-3,7-dideoxy-D-threo-hept-6-ulosonate synthase [Streptomyces sp. XM4011]|uniref:class I fructose-bisphosphate aldolase n=1 Tax=Streptomyces sp. XM4011 TaxID=2929780 RepID=UPI001FF70801|nr:2-amino-3,7-dideoxy-D-threo-hept-6-ulosonate synthase [Streptomyces sp. XM4011]MCK1815692.1 2-amino-3,7-dideoxy-D-threo-hept-6-ulosonate synthase [Streptomyces sp. XM4011]
MELHDSFARRLRLTRLHHHGDQRLFVVPLDHSLTLGPIAGRAGLSGLLRQLITGGVDGVVLHKGALRHVDPALFTDTSLIVHLSASTRHAPDPDAKYLVSGVEEALRMGADAVSTHLNLGSAEERGQIADLAAVADACDRWNMPLMAMVYPRGPGITDPRDPELVAHAVTLAADLGADVVKTVLPDPASALADITAACPVPVILAGGPSAPDPAAVHEHVRTALAHGAAGVAMGRNVFGARDPAAMVRQVAGLVHGTATTSLPRQRQPVAALNPT